MYQSRTLAPLLIILVVLLVAVGGYWYKEGKITGLPWSLGRDSMVLESQAEPGRVVDGFPAGLIIVSDAVISESALYRRGEEHKVLRAVYLTEASVPDLYAAYISYLNDRNYSILRSNSTGGVSAIRAKLGEEEVAISMSLSKENKKEVKIDVQRPVIQ